MCFLLQNVDFLWTTYIAAAPENITLRKDLKRFFAWGIGSKVIEQLQADEFYFSKSQDTLCNYVLHYQIL